MVEQVAGWVEQKVFRDGPPPRLPHLFTWPFHLCPTDSASTAAAIFHNIRLTWYTQSKERWNCWEQSGQRVSPTCRGQLLCQKGQFTRNFSSVSQLFYKPLYKRFTYVYMYVENEEKPERHDRVFVSWRTEHSCFSILKCWLV